MPELDQNKKENFAQTMSQVLNYGALNLAMAVGYRLGIFEAMAACAGPEACETLAQKAGVSPRYLREWLGVMATGRVVELAPGDNGAERYFLPPEHADYLLRGSEMNLGVYTQEIPLLTSCAQPQVEICFKKGCGVPYERYPDFQAFMAELADAKHQQTLVEVFLPSVDGGRLLERLQEGIEVCDLGCGSGLAARLMARAFPRSNFVGVDISEQALEMARRQSAGQGLENLSYQVGDAAVLAGDSAWAERYDYVTSFDSIHDQTEPAKALQSVRWMLKPDGLFSMVDIAAHSDHQGNLDHPMGPFLYAVSLMHCMPVGLNDSGQGLGMMWGKELALSMLEQTGFSQVDVLEMEFDPFNLHFQCRK